MNLLKCMFRYESKSKKVNLNENSTAQPKKRVCLYSVIAQTISSFSSEFIMLQNNGEFQKRKSTNL